MAKEKKPKQVEESSRFELPTGAVIVGYEDGSFKLFPAPIELTASDIETLFGGESSSDDDDDAPEVSIEDMKEALLEAEAFTKKELKKMSDEEIEEAYGELETDDDDDSSSDDDDDDTAATIDEMKEALLASGVTKKELKKMDDDEIEEAYNELENDDDDDDSGSDDDDDDELTGEALADMDFEELEDVCDDKELETDPDDFEEEDIEKLRKAIAKELDIKLPKAKK